jgi:uncharacterized protein (TIGR03382 family)
MLSLLTLLLSTSAGAYEAFETDQGDAMRWGQMPIEWHYNPDAVAEVDRHEEALERAFETWSTVPDADIDFLKMGHTDVATPDADDENTVYWESDWVWDPDTLALASTWADSEGEILAFDLRINASPGITWSTNDSPGFDLQAALAHEVGHVLGLNHSVVEDATMYRNHSEQDTSRRLLHWDDEDGARYLYPPSNTDNPSNLALIGCSHASAVPSFPFVFLSFALAFRRRRSP